MAQRKASLETDVYEDGSIELVVLGMLAALIVVLAVPLFVDSPEELERSKAQQEDAVVQIPVEKN